MDQTAALSTIRCPILVISGDLDVSLPWQGHSEVIARTVPGARVVHLPAAHLSNLEMPRSFTAALLQFLMPTSEAADVAGMRVRRSVLGDAHVDRAIATTTAITKDFQELITRYAWGTIWTRPLLDVRTRRLLVLSTTAALGRWEEFRLHVRTGLNRDLEWCDLEEVLLQTAIYAGVPAANTGFHAAADEARAQDPRSLRSRLMNLTLVPRCERARRASHATERAGAAARESACRGVRGRSPSDKLVKRRLNSRSAFSWYSFFRSAASISSVSRILIVSRMYIDPPSGSNGASDANTTWSNPKNFNPHSVAARLPKTAVSAQNILK